MGAKRKGKRLTFTCRTAKTEVLTRVAACLTQMGQETEQKNRNGSLLTRFFHFLVPQAQSRSMIAYKQIVHSTNLFSPRTLFSRTIPSISAISFADVTSSLPTQPSHLLSLVG